MTALYRKVLQQFYGESIRSTLNLSPRSVRVLLSAAFFLLVVAIATSYVVYWRMSFEPELKAEAESKAGMLTEAHAGVLQLALEKAIDEGDTWPLDEALNKVLVLQSASGTPYVTGVRISTDPLYLTPELDLSDYFLGERCQDCIKQTVVLYGRNGAVIGSATFETSTAFVTELSHNAYKAFLATFAFVIFAIILFSLAIHWLFHRLATSEQNARSAAEAKSVFLTTMSHEIRTPMSAIIGSSDLLAKTELSLEQKSLLTSISTAGETLLSLIDDILSFASLEGKPPAPRHESVDIRALVSDITTMIEPTVANKPITLSAEVSEHVPARLRSDRVRIRQILLNLLSNASKFTHEGYIVLSVRTLIDRLIFEVSDSGIGITPEVAANLFEPFVQGDQTFTRPYGGSGLGLTITARLVETLGGSIEINSESGAGTTFRVDIPLIPVTPSAVGADCNPDPTPVHQVPLRILLVEDTRTNRLVARRLLETSGHTVDEAENGEEAVYRVCQSPAPYDVILMDVQMPIMDGLAACRAIRGLQDTERARTPIIALTAHAFEQERRRCLSAGMDEVVTKPFEVDTLTALLYEVIARETRKAS